ncbi:hypothetical protein BIY24_06995 [Halobacteriovorax marinus]|uniref:sigma 54-interacting transcriptional regulator n=1 Tax=Halobacteriovorax marinus TaxID=97084 RepID=UPI000BC2E8A1|nr:sigma 54-interacting transcriptional regulator [Halobacteriovorax marinus]ATH07699.1 hypothetical protein BIY24_06995 [Halobacteriovorax marinus]
MGNGLKNFKFYRSFRVRSEQNDKIFLRISLLHQNGNRQTLGQDTRLIDFNLFSLSFKSNIHIPIGTKVKIEIFTKKIFNKWDLEVEGFIIRSFQENSEEQTYNYGVELINQSEESELKYFITDYIAGFSGKKLKDFLIKSSLSVREINVDDGVELFGLLNVLYKEFSRSDISSLLDECAHLLHCEEVRVWKINLEKDKLENIYHSSNCTHIKDNSFNKGELGKCFTTSRCINTFLKEPKERDEDKFTLNNTLCLPLLNKERKCIGVLQFNNKKGGQFSIIDENMGHFLSLVIAKRFLNYIVKSKSTSIAHLNPELKDSFIYFGSTQKSSAIRTTLKKLKYGKTNVFIVGEKGLGKEFFAKYLSNNSEKDIFNCKDPAHLEKILSSTSNFSSEQTLIFKNIDSLSSSDQSRLYNWIQFQDCKFITTSCKDLIYEIKSGLFHKQLYKKLTQSRFHLTPLRNRRDDILTIANYFIRIECVKRGLAPRELSPESMQYIISHYWPGNITELEKVIKKTFMLTSHDCEVIDIEKEEIHGFKNIEEKLIFSADTSIHPDKIMEMIKSETREKKVS